MRLPLYAVLLLGCLSAAGQETPAPATSEPIDLSERYPIGRQSADCAWTFEQDDIFRIARFNYEGPNGLRLKTGPADLGIGHCDDNGAVWALVIPRKRGQLVSEASPQMELLDHIWLRFHPSELNTLFPPDTVKGAGQSLRHFRMQRIAKAKFRNSYHKGPRATLPPPGTLIVDTDTLEGTRRFFAVDRKKKRAEYMNMFEKRTVPGVRLMSSDDAGKVIDAVWKKFDQTYAGFVLRPDVDWDKQREAFRTRSGEVSNTVECGQLLAEMLRPLEDLHVWLRVDNEVVPVYRRPRPTNGDLIGVTRYVQDVKRLPGDVRWGRTEQGVGYIGVDSLRSRDLVESVDTALESLKDAKALVLDLRFNGGGNEKLAQRVAGRFTKGKVPYAASRVRSGPQHSDLSDKQTRTLEPRGPWTWEKPVYVLIGQRCMSSAEAMAAMFAELPHATLAGDRTAGSSGNPEEFDAGHGIVVSVPRWVAYRLDGKPLDGNGIEPDLKLIHDPQRRVADEPGPLLEKVLQRIE